MIRIIRKTISDGQQAAATSPIYVVAKTGTYSFLDRSRTGVDQVGQQYTIYFWLKSTGSSSMGIYMNFYYMILDFINDKTFYIGHLLSIFLI